MELKALLIGINAYPTNPLTQCIADVTKMSHYLEGLKGPFTGVSIKTLKDSKATRANILKEIKTHLGSAGDTDVALLYYSGHGAQEECPGLFPDVHDGLLECLVCYDPHDALDSGQLLTSKEIRYALSQLPHNPHLVTIIDACHSGDIVRAFHADDTKGNKRIKRIAGTFPARPFKDFLFAADKTLVTNDQGPKQLFIPAKNHIHIAACQSSESSWEDGDGGVFTRYLLELLKATEGKLSYLDITRWAKLSMQDVTSEKQTPTIYTVGEGKTLATDSWLNMHPKGFAMPQGRVINTVNEGWVYTRGALLGVQPDMEVIIDLGNGKEEKVKVDAVSLEKSTLHMSLPQVNMLSELNKPFFTARTELSTLNQLKLSVVSIDHEPAITKEVTKTLKANKLVKIVDTAAADFQCTIFNGFAYFTLPEHDFQPLARQISIGNKTALKKELERQLGYFVKWQHFYALDNPGKDYEQSPIRIEVESEKKWVDITNGVLTMRPDAKKVYNGELFQTAKIRVNNKSKETLHVGVLTLNSDMSITSKPFKGKSVTLVPGESQTILLYNEEDSPVVRASLDMYKEVYNWKEEWFYYKFIYSNDEDFTTSMQGPEFRQPVLEPPLFFKKATKSLTRAAKGEGSGEPPPDQKKWGTCLTQIKLPNLYHNIIHGNLKELWDQYEASEDMAPLIKELYFDEVFDGTSYKLMLKQNKDQTAAQATSKATDSWLVKALNSLYKAGRIRRFKRQRKQTGPIVVAEGDSWFLFPKPGVRDTLDYIMDHYRLLSLAEAGDEITDYIKNPELLTSVIKENPDFVLISGGGNDILGEQVQAILKSDVKNGVDATDFLKVDVFNQKLDQLRKGYISFFEKIHVLKPEAKIFIHGYDYIRSDPDARTIKSGWANRYMIKAGIDNVAHRELIIHYLVDTFNTMLEEFATKYDYVRYVNHRGTVKLNEWMDEIHPNNTGYEKVAKNFLKAMQAV